MNQKLKTSIEFAKNLLVTGAVTETSRDVELEICNKIPPRKDVVVVEYGMGHGNITRQILRSVSENSRVYAFDVKKEFCDHVRQTIDDDRLIIVQDSAEHVSRHVNEKVDIIIASIPFSFFSKEKSSAIIQESYDILNVDCFYSQVLYTKFNFKKFEAVFDQCEMIKIPNFPTAYVYHCLKQ